MEIILLDKAKDENKISFVARGITAALANTIRRAVVEEVPTMAIEEVEFRKNNSILYDEMVAHRLGLVPLKTNLKAYNLPSECKCEGEGCARCEAKLTLKTRASGNVYASELKCSDKDIEPIYPKMPITKLMKGQSIELEATAILGKGKEHIKWAPGHIYYYNEPKISINNDEKLIEENRDKYPPQIYGKDGKVDEKLINTPALIDACEGVSELINIERKEDSFIFVLESWGQLKPNEIIEEAINQVNNQLDEIAKLMK